MWIVASVFQCLKADALLFLSGLGPSRDISVENFVDLCPSLVLQLDSHVCFEDGHHHHGHHLHGHHIHDHDDSGHAHDEELPKWRSAAGELRYVITDLLFLF